MITQDDCKWDTKTAGWGEGLRSAILTIVLYFVLSASKVLLPSAHL
jgi:hypothetical protein